MQYNCTRYSLHTQYMLLTHADNLVCLQLHTVHASNLCWWLAVPTAAHSTVSIRSTCFWPMLMTAVPTATHTHSMVSIDSTCFWPMLMTCCAYSCTQYSLIFFTPLRFTFPPLFRCVSKILKKTTNFIMSVVLPSAWDNSTPTGWIFMKFGISVFRGNLSRKFKFH